MESIVKENCEKTIITTVDTNTERGFSVNYVLGAEIKHSL